MTTSAPGACSAPRRRLCSALLSLQRLLHPSPLPLARSIAAQASRALFPSRTPTPGQGSPDSSGTPRQHSLPCSPPVLPLWHHRSSCRPTGVGYGALFWGALTPLPGLPLSSAGSVSVPLRSPSITPSALPPRTLGGTGVPRSTALLPPGTHRAPPTAASPAPVPPRLQFLPLPVLPHCPLVPSLPSSAPSDPQYCPPH